LREFRRWDSATIERVKIEITQEVKRAWSQVPVTARALSTLHAAQDDQQPHTQPPRETDDAVPVSPQPPDSEGVSSPATPRYTLGQLISFLDSIEHSRDFHRLNQQEQLRRSWPALVEQAQPFVFQLICCPRHYVRTSTYRAALRRRALRGQRLIRLWFPVEGEFSNPSCGVLERMWQPRHDGARSHVEPRTFREEGPHPGARLRSGVHVRGT
jgi:hypothetical protein